MKPKPLSRRSEIVVQELKNELLVYDLKINKVCESSVEKQIKPLIYVEGIYFEKR